jgi:hypothetical protein
VYKMAKDESQLLRSGILLPLYLLRALLERLPTVLTDTSTLSRYLAYWCYYFNECLFECHLGVALLGNIAQNEQRALVWVSLGYRSTRQKPQKTSDESVLMILLQRMRVWVSHGCRSTRQQPKKTNDEGYVYVHSDYHYFTEVWFGRHSTWQTRYVSVLMLLLLQRMLVLVWLY